MRPSQPTTHQGDQIVKHNQLVDHFTHHPPPTTPIANLHERTRSAAFDLAMFINENIPDSPEKELSITKIEEAMMWANAAIARNHG
jgi:hypothetical protein